MNNPIKEFKNIFIQIFRMFRVKKEEALPAIVALLVYVFLNALVVMRYADEFTGVTRNFWKHFVNSFHISGFDPITYVVVSQWNPVYNIYRHPLLAFFVYPLSVIDGWVLQTTGVNVVQFLIAAILLFIVFYSFIFMMRICRDIIGVNNIDAILLSALLFSFAYVMLPYIVPDHFGPSMFMLLMALYVCGVKLRDKKRLDGWQTMLMFLFTAGITLSNGLKVFVDALFVDGKRFFKPRYLLFAVIIPAAIIWGFARWEYAHYQYPSALKRAELKKQKSDKQKAKDFALFRDTTSLKDSTEIKHAFDAMMKQKIIAKYRADHKQPGFSHKGKPIANGEFSSWTDITTPRWDSIVENLFGESIQVHPDYLLGDTLRGRPVIVYYNLWINYIVEFILVLLFGIGIWSGRKNRFLWMVLGGFCVDLFIHVILGFGLNEVYIMGAHWLFVMPIAMAYMFRNLDGRWLSIVRMLVLALTAFVFSWNICFISTYLLGVTI